MIRAPADSATDDGVLGPLGMATFSSVRVRMICRCVNAVGADFENLYFY